MLERRPWISPDTHEIVCLLPGRDVSCLRRGQTVLVDGERSRVVRIDRRRNRIKVRTAE